MASVLRFDQIDSSMVPLVGGKAANLGRLVAEGLPVPVGFCVSSPAYREVVGDRLDEVVDLLERATSQAEIAGLAARARQLVRQAPVPAALRNELRDSYAVLGDGPVAVRSSATAEDLDFASFAGQQDSFLNVVGPESVLDAVRRCWASLWTERAVRYRSSTGVDHADVALAVVVQQMVQSVAAGVLFTANPITGTRRQSVIDASGGLGEAVVSGAVNPDHYVVDTDRAEILERRLGDKRVVIRSRPDGGTQRIDRDDASASAALSDRHVLELAALGARVESCYETPQDIEWALDEHDVLWLTQARPITTLYPLPESPSGDRRVFLCLTLAQGLTRPITPLGLASIRVLGAAVAAAAGFAVADPRQGPQAMSTAGQRVFVDFTAVVSNRHGRRAVIGLLRVMEARTAVVLERLVAQPGFSVRQSSTWSILRPVVRVLRQARLPQRALLALISPASAYRSIAALEADLRRNLVLPDELSPGQRLDAVRTLLERRVFWAMPTVAAYALPGFALLGLAGRLIGSARQPGELQTVLRGLPHNVTTEMDLELWRLSQHIGADLSARASFAAPPTELAAAFSRSDLPEVAQRGLAEFLRRYGHRAVAEIDLGMPRWSDDPTHLLGVIANYLRLEDPALAADVQFAAGAAAAEVKVADLTRRARDRSRVRGVAVAWCLRRARQLAGLREAPKNLAVLALAGVRAQLQVVGDALVTAHHLDHRDDVFFLDLSDVRHGLDGLDLRERVRELRAAYDGELKRRHIPNMLLSDGTEPEAVGAPDEVAGALVGSPASAGTVTGRARVVLDPVGAHLEPGEILIAPSTDPGWTPLFLTAGGLVMEMGGANSHGAVVAREYGIPAVVGVPEATSRIRSGELVRVDGAAGLVQLDVKEVSEGPRG